MLKITLKMNTVSSTSFDEKLNCQNLPINIIKIPLNTGAIRGKRNSKIKFVKNKKG